MSDDTSRVMDDAEIKAAERQAESRLALARTRALDPELDARVQGYLRRPYRMEVKGDPQEGYLALAPELPGCITAGATPEEAMQMLRDAMATWLEATIATGEPVPEPDENHYSGRMLLRLPKSLHARLARQAARENVSINQLATTMLAEGLGRDNALWRLFGSLPPETLDEVMARLGKLRVNANAQEAHPPGRGSG